MDQLLPISMHSESGGIYFFPWKLSFGCAVLYVFCNNFYRKRVQRRLLLLMYRLLFSLMQPLLNISIQANLFSLQMGILKARCHNHSLIVTKSLPTKYAFRPTTRLATTIDMQILRKLMLSRLNTTGLGLNRRRLLYTWKALYLKRSSSLNPSCCPDVAVVQL